MAEATLEILSEIPLYRNSNSEGTNRVTFSDRRNGWLLIDRVVIEQIFREQIDFQGVGVDAHLSVDHAVCSILKIG